MAFTQTEEVSEAVPRVVWQKVLGEGERWFRFESMTQTPKGELMISAVADMPPGSDVLNNQFWYGTLSPDGGLSGWRQLAKPDRDRQGKALPSQLSENIRLGASGEDSQFMLVDFVENRPFAVRVDRKGETILSREIGEPEQRLNIMKMVPLDGGRHLVIGYDHFKPLIMELDAGGNSSWIREKDLGPVTPEVDAIANSEGFVIFKNIQIKGVTGIGYRTWIGLFDGQGLLRADLEMDGRHLQAAAAPDGMFYLLRDMGDSDVRDLRVLRVDDSLQPYWEQEIFYGKNDMTGFRLAAMPMGDVVVSGSKGYRPYLVRFDTNGEKVWDHVAEDLKMGTQYDVTVSRDNAVYLASTIHVKEEQGYRARVRLIKFR